VGVGGGGGEVEREVGGSIMTFINTRWETLLPMVVSIGAAIWTAVIWKRQKKLENKLARSIAAYDIILHKEFEYYQKDDPILAELIVCVQDISVSLTGEIKYGRPMDISNRCKIARENFLMYLEDIKELKSLDLQYEIYLPETVYHASTNVVVLMQTNTDLLNRSLELLVDNRE
jgi:hypothetical protein